MCNELQTNYENFLYVKGYTTFLDVCMHHLSLSGVVIVLKMFMQSILYGYPTFHQVEACQLCVNIYVISNMAICV